MEDGGYYEEGGGRGNELERESCWGRFPPTPNKTYGVLGGVERGRRRRRNFGKVEDVVKRKKLLK